MWRGVALAFVASLLAAPAFAADVVRPLPVAVVPVVKSNPLDGFYLGGNAGYAWDNRKGCFEFDSFPADCSDRDSEDFNYNQKGWLLGGQVGFNHFFDNGGSHSLFFGAEVSDDIADITGHLDDLGVGTTTNVGSAMAKLGIGFGAIAVYGEAGIGIDSFEFSGPFCTFNQQNSGFGYGVGAEAAMSGHNSLFVKWDHFNFSSKDASCTGSPIPVPLSVHTTPTLNIFKVGFNHYFN